MKLQSILALAGASRVHHSVASSIVPTIWDGHCFYPQADASFDINTYEGRWYQVAGTLARFTQGCRCISALYSLNDDGSLYVNNTCTRGDKATFIEGRAVAADEAYGKVGVLRVRFPVQPSLACEGPNYIVQEYTGEIAIVQSHNFTNLFILSKKQKLPEDELESWIDRAVALGTPRDRIHPTDQTNCP